MGCIYLIRNLKNNKCYIGQTLSDAVKGRINDHLNGNSKGSRLVKRAVGKYGKDAFTYEILHDGIIPEFLDDLEREAIEKFNTIAPDGYNLTTGGEGGSHCEQTRRKLSEINTGKKLSVETRRKMSKRKGWKHTEESRRKMSESSIGKKHTDESRRKISEAKKGKTHSKETRRKLSEINTGKKRGPHSKDHRRKISETLKGEKNPNYGKTHSEEMRRKISEGNKGKTHTEESRRKIGNAHKGKKLSEENRRKISEAKETPDRMSAREIYFSLPPNMELKEKRKHLRQRFPNKHSTTVHRWCKKFDSEVYSIED